MQCDESLACIYYDRETRNPTADDSGPRPPLERQQPSELDMMACATQHAEDLFPMPLAPGGMDTIAQIAPEVIDANALRTALEAAKENLSAVKDKTGGCTSQQDFLEHAKAVLKPGFEYYRDLFERTGKKGGNGKARGELKPLKDAFMAAAVFDAVELSKMNAAQAESCIDRLSLLGFPEFKDENFITQLKEELPAAKIAV